VSEYKAHNQNWAVSQTRDLWMYFANTDGLLSYNGNQWSKYPLKNNKIIRSVHCVGDKIYTGAYGEFGYWLRDDCGMHQYQSLNDLIPSKSMEKEEIWHITSEGKDVYFQSFSLLMKYDGKTIKKLELPGSIMFLNIIQGRKVIQSIGYGIFEIRDDDHFMLDGSDFFADKTVTGISTLPNGGQGLLIATSTHGVFSLVDGKVTAWNPNFQNYFAESQVNKILLTQENILLIGTIRDGLLGFNADGSLKFHIQTSNGLQNNTILAMSQDNKGHLWLGLDKGIALVKMSENILFYKDDSGNLGTVYSMIKHNDMLYVGTNQGVYYYNNAIKQYGPQSNAFKLVKGTQGQVWELKKVGDVIICGHNDGTFIIDKTTATKISDVTGGWFTQNIKGRDDWFIQGTYTGLVVYIKDGQNYKFSHKINGYNEPVKKVIQADDDQFWVTGPNTGITLLKFDASFKNVTTSKQYAEKQGLKRGQNLDVNLLKERLIVFDGNKHYFYDRSADVFKEDTTLNSNDTNYQIRVINDSLWVKIYADSLAIMNGSKAHLVHHISVNRDYNSITLLDDATLGVCLNEGYATIKWKSTLAVKNGSALTIYKIVLGEDQTCLPILDKAKPITIDFVDNAFKVHFYDNEYTPTKTYYYRLLPFDDEWKVVSEQNFVEFNNLTSGDYKFELKRDQGFEALNVQILPPWYKSKLLLLLYGLLFGFGLWWLKRYFDHQLAVQKEKLNAENARLMRERLIELENDRLVQDNLTKSKELANATMHLVQKNELLQEIKEELIQIRKSGDQILTTKDFQVMMKQINENLTVQEDKKLFNASFEDVHEAFFKKIKATYPDLSSDDLRLAAYLRMNLASKDIAPLFNISIRGLENKRYRLRKKLGLPSDENLTDFFNNL
jgi:ligand-binding sensor domain-containing protein